jgi:hypothetical protein
LATSTKATVPSVGELPLISRSGAGAWITASSQARQAGEPIRIELLGTGANCIRCTDAEDAPGDRFGQRRITFSAMAMSRSARKPRL